VTRSSGFFDDVEARFGTVTAVVNNAATARYGPLDDFSPAEDRGGEIATKLTGALFMARRGIQAMRADGHGGDILFVASLAAATPWPFHLPYAAANAGVEQAARTLRLELEGTGIRSPRSVAARPSAPTSPPARWRTAARLTPTSSGSA